MNKRKIGAALAIVLAIIFIAACIVYAYMQRQYRRQWVYERFFDGQGVPITDIASDFEDDLDDIVDGK